MIDHKKKRNLVIILLFLLGLGLRLLLLFHTNYTADDSFITFRYAENISSGLGFVYNAGERVLGTTTPLYTLLLSALLKTGLDVVTLGKAINILADCLAGVFVFLLLVNFGFGFAFLASLFYLFFPRVMVWSVSGMETGLYVFVISLSFYFYNRKNFNLVPFFLALVWLTRFDGLILIAALFLDYLLNYRRVPLRMIGFVFLLILPWVIFAAAYFGSPIPNSIWAKKALYQGVLQTPQEIIIWEFMVLKNVIGWIMLAFCFLGTYRILKTQKELRFIVLWTVFYLCFYLISGTRMHIWYYVPFYLGYMILAAQGLFFVHEHLGWLRGELAQGKKLPLSLKEIRVALLILLVVSFSFVYWRQMERTAGLVKGEQMVLEQIHKKIGLWLKENSDPGDTVCAEDIGYMGYFSRRYILDQDGLVSPQAVPFNQQKDRLGLIRTYLPRYVVIGFYGPYYRKVIHSGWFKKNYKFLARFSILGVSSDEFTKDSSEPDLDEVPEFAIYKRFEDFG